MKPYFPFATALFAALLIAAPLPAAPTVSVPTQTQAAFGEDCEKLILAAIKESRKSIDAAVYTFTRRQIADALISAHRRGVHVDLKVDAKQAKWEGMQDVLKRMTKAGITVTLITMPRSSNHMHHKFIVVDDRTVVTGSYNYTTSATIANHENVVRVNSRAIAKAYRDAFARIESPKTK